LLVLRLLSTKQKQGGRSDIAFSFGFSYTNDQIRLLAQTCRNSSRRHVPFGFMQNPTDYKFISSSQPYEPIQMIFHHADHQFSTHFLLLAYQWRWEWADRKDKAFTPPQRKPQHFLLPYAR